MLLFQASGAVAWTGLRPSHITRPNRRQDSVEICRSEASPPGDAVELWRC